MNSPLKLVSETPSVSFELQTLSAQHSSGSKSITLNIIRIVLGTIWITSSTTIIYHWTACSREGFKLLLIKRIDINDYKCISFGSRSWQFAQIIGSCPLGPLAAWKMLRHLRRRNVPEDMTLARTLARFQGWKWTSFKRKNIMNFASTHFDLQHSSLTFPHGLAESDWLSTCEHLKAGR